MYYCYAEFTPNKIQYLTGDESLESLIDFLCEFITGDTNMKDLDLCKETKSFKIYDNDLQISYYIIFGHDSEPGCLKTYNNVVIHHTSCFGLY